MMLLRLSWRNLWRNRRRSFIVVTSIVVGIFLMDYAGSFARGMMRQMFENELGIYTAHLQVHSKGFLKNKVVERFMPPPDSVLAVIRSLPGVRAVAPRTVSFGLVSSATASSGVSIIGIDPKEESRVTTIDRFIIAGRGLTGASHEVLLSRRLAKTLDISLGDRVVGMVSGADGTVGSELFRVTGLFQSASLSYDKMNIYVPIADAQSMLRVDARIAEIAAIMDEPDSALATKVALERALGDTYEVHTYHDLLPNLLSQIELSDKIMSIFFVLIGAAMLFGIVNTLLMSVFERIREFGVLKSMGMQDSHVALMILIEASLLGVIGTSIGVAIAICLNLVLSRTGLNLAMFSEGLAAFGTGAIIYPVMNLWATVQEIMVVLGMCLIAAIAPIRRAMRLEPVDAIRHL